ncbi:MAG: prephenate dehydrogenase/arogenate dehydrogenase family protein [Desulfarculaceae bacterium]|nr:prephenate dehydrogenase/arogenate dehydrogenase family protein [Desulfarculaceae bacterium]
MRPVETIGIIGGKGGMGQWFKTFFTGRYDFRVLVSDLDTRLCNEDLAESCDVVLLSTSVEAAVTIMEQIGPILRENQLLMDLCSQKEVIVEKMVSSARCEVVGMHPMFGPFTESLDSQNIVLSPGRGEEGIDWADRLFSGAGARVTRMEASLHDRNMAVVQGLTHFLSICFARTLQKMDLHPTRMFHTSTPIFRINSDIIGRLFAQDPELYASLIHDNRYVPDVLDAFYASMKESSAFLIEDSTEKGSDYISGIGEFIGKYRQDAILRSNRFLNIIFEEQEDENASDV